MAKLHLKKAWSIFRLSVRRLWKALKQINNTPHPYGDTHRGYRIPYKVMSELPTPASMKFSRFPYKDKSENTFINYVVCQGCAKKHIALTVTNIQKVSHSGSTGIKDSLGGQNVLDAE